MKLNDNAERDPRLFAIPDTHGHAKGEHKPYTEERPLPLTARMLFLWFYHACRRGFPRFLMVADHMNYLTFEDPAAVNLVRRALKLAQAGDLYGAAETANVDVAHAAVVSEGLRRGMRYSIGAEVDNDPRSRPDAQNIVDAMRPDGIIRSVHFLPVTHPVHGENWAWPFDNPEFREHFDAVGTERTWELYVNALVDAIERLPGHIVGHFFVPAVFGHWPDDGKLEEYEDRVLAAAEARGMAVEFNTRFLYREADDLAKARYLAANKRFLRKAKERGVQIAIGSDAHSPKDQGGAFDIVLDLLDELEINEIVFPMGGQLRRVALRVIREPEPEPVPEPPAPPPPEPAKPRVAAAAAKPVRKARPAAKAARAPDTTPERPAERPGSAPAPPEPPPQQSAETAPEQPRAKPSKAPARPKTAKPEPAAEPPAQPAAPNAAKAAAAAVKAVAAKAVAAVKAVAAKPAPAKAGAAKPPVPKPAAKTVAAKPVAAKPVAAKPVAAKPVATKKPAGKPAAKPSAVKRPPAKPTAKAPARATSAAKKPAAKPVPARPKKAAPARGGAKKAAPKRAAPAKKAGKKAAPARAAVKKAAPKKSVAKNVSRRAKKTAAKKTATKRR